MRRLIVATGGFLLAGGISIGAMANEALEDVGSAVLSLEELSASTGAGLEAERVIDIPTLMPAERAMLPTLELSRAVKRLTLEEVNADRSRLTLEVVPPSAGDDSAN